MRAFVGRNSVSCIGQNQSLMSLLTWIMGTGNLIHFLVWRIWKSSFTAIVSPSDFVKKCCFFQMKVVYLRMNVFESIGRLLNPSLNNLPWSGCRQFLTSRPPRGAAPWGGARRTTSGAWRPRPRPTPTRENRSWSGTRTPHRASPRWRCSNSWNRTQFRRRAFRCVFYYEKFSQWNKWERNDCSLLSKSFKEILPNNH